MKKYLITTREVWTQAYEVEALSPAQAKEQVKKHCEIYLLDNTLEYSHSLNEDTWTVEEIPLD